MPRPWPRRRPMPSRLRSAPPPRRTRPAIRRRGSGRCCSRAFLARAPSRVAACSRDRIESCARMRRVAAAIATAGSLLVAMPARALWDDALTLIAEEKVTHDDNVFRISRDLDPVAAIGSPSKADTYRTLSLGLKFDLPVSLQRFQLDYTHHQERYNRFSDLDFAGHDAHALWSWQLSSDASGQLGYEDSLALASFANIQSRAPDPVRLRRTFFTATVPATARWRGQAGSAGLGQTNRDRTRQIFDAKIATADLALSYVTPADNSAGIG